MTSISRARRTESASSPASAWSSESAGFAWRAVVSPAGAVTLAVAARVALTGAASARARATALASSPPRPQAAAADARRANPNHALRATGLSLHAGGLDVRPDLELGLEQRAVGVAQGLGGGGAGRGHLEIVRDDDPLQARDVGHELADLIVVADDRHVVLVGVERHRTRLDRQR